MSLTWLLRYELIEPTAAKKNDLTAWMQAARNAATQLEHQQNRFVPNCIGGVIDFV